MMTASSQRGRFITFEGGEGSGKSTQIRLLAETLKQLGVAAVVTREPGGSPGAEIMRHLVLSGVGKVLGSAGEALLFAAARDDHVRSVIAPALIRGQWVLCDRFTDSTLAYQGYLGDVEISLLRAMDRVTIAGLRPDLTFILDIDPEIGMARAATRRGQEAPDRFEAEDISFHRRLREAYRRIAADEPDRCVVVDAASDAISISIRIAAIVVDRFGLRDEAPLEVYIP